MAAPAKTNHSFCTSGNDKFQLSTTIGTVDVVQGPTPGWGVGRFSFVPAKASFSIFLSPFPPLSFYTLFPSPMSYALCLKIAALCIYPTNNCSFTLCAMHNGDRDRVPGGKRAHSVGSR